MRTIEIAGIGGWLETQPVPHNATDCSSRGCPILAALFAVRMGIRFAGIVEHFVDARLARRRFDTLERDHAFLLKGDALTEALLRTYVDEKY